MYRACAHALQSEACSGSRDSLDTRASGRDANGVSEWSPTRRAAQRAAQGAVSARPVGSRASWARGLTTKNGAREKTPGRGCVRLRARDCVRGAVSARLSTLRTCPIRRISALSAACAPRSRAPGHCRGARAIDARRRSGRPSATDPPRCFASPCCTPRTRPHALRV